MKIREPLRRLHGLVWAAFYGWLRTLVRRDCNGFLDHGETMHHSRSQLRAEPGDRLIIKGHHVGEPPRDAEILEVLGDAGAPPFVVRWEDDGRVTECFPAEDAEVHHFKHETG